METSYLIAKIIGVIYISFGIGLFVNREFYREVIPKLVESSSFLLVGGIIALIVGVLIIENHNYWVGNWTVLITIIGWIALIKGFMLIAFPKKMVLFKSFFNSNAVYKILAPLVFLFGLYFLYLGFLG